MSLIPLPYRILAVVAALAALFGAGWWRGSAHTEAAWQARMAAQALATQRAQTAQAQTSVRVVTQYVDRVRVVHDVGQTITREVIKYVTPAADARCTVNRGAVRVLDAAATSVPLDPPARDTDAAPAGVALSALAESVADNYATCQANAEQLIALQTWVRSLAADSAPAEK